MMEPLIELEALKAEMDFYNRMEAILNCEKRPRLGIEGLDNFPECLLHGIGAEIYIRWDNCCKDIETGKKIAIQRIDYWTGIIRKESLKWTGCPFDMNGILIRTPYLPSGRQPKPF
jgi:hypothetical protein